MTPEDLQALQVTYEKLSLDEGKLRYLKQQERTTESNGYGYRDDVSKLIKDCLPKVSSEVSKYLTRTKGKGKTPQGDAYLSYLDHDLLALIALNRAFTGVGAQQSVSAIICSIGKGVEDELWALALKEHDKSLYNRLVESAIKKHGAVSYRRKSIRSTASKGDKRRKVAPFSMDRWSDDLRVKVGEPLFNAVLLGCPETFETYLAPSGKNSTTRLLGLTEEGSSTLMSITDMQGWMQPVFKPMLVRPRPWTDFDSGAYLTDELRSKAPLVRTFDRQHIKLIKAAIRDGSMQPCLDALTLIQDTPWRINKRVFEVMLWAWENDKPVVPSKVHLPRPVRPENYEELDEDRKKGWRIRAAKTVQCNRAIDSDRVVMLQDIGSLTGLVQHERFWLPHSLDFRGRVYALPHVNQMRADHIKGCLEFADGIAVGDSGAYWLALHLANCGDFNKVSKAPLEERVLWTINNAELIKEIANDPIATFDLWKDADKPIQYLAACMDYAGYLAVGDDYVSHLPVALDGSNSGLQHFSASLRSVEGGLVNLIPQDRPADIYQLVADTVVESVEADIEAKGPDADIAQVVMDNGITRSLVKRNAMTFSYSSEEYGFKKQHMTDLMRPLELKVLSGELPAHPYGEDGGFRAAGYIAKKVWNAITSIVKDATEGMRFYQRCAAVLAHEEKGLHWVTPVGLPVLHKYTDWDTKTVKLFLYDKKVPVIEAGKEDKIIDDQVHKQVRLTIRTNPTKTVNKDKAKSAVSPNITHSLDAAHLMMTVLAAKAEGITNFCLIHDSFATHAAHTSDFFYIIREQFVSMYQSYCPYEAVQKATYDALDDKTLTPTLPTKGELNVQAVSDSLYAFA